MELKRKLDTKTDELKVAEEKVARAAESGALTGRVKYLSNIEKKTRSCDNFENIEISNGTYRG